MKTLLFLIAIWAVSLQWLHAQQVVWADKVVDHSSHFVADNNPKAYLPEQALGPPSVLPGTENFSECAWATKDPNAGKEFLKLGFPKPLTAQQVTIVENTYPGAIVKVVLFGDRGRSQEVLNNPSGEKHTADQPLIITFPATAWPVEAILIELDTKLESGHNQIDAVAISDSKTPVKVGVRLAEGSNMKIEKEKLSDHINSDADELSPVISPDGKTLYFTRQNHPENYGFSRGESPQDIWYAEAQPDGGFSKAVNMGAPLNDKSHNALMSITPDGQQVLLLNTYLKEGGHGRGVSVSRLESKGWGWPETVVIEDYYNDSKYGEYMMTADGKTMMMTVQRDEGYGNKDVYVSFLKDDGNWTKPKNLGPVINTAASETSPFLAADGITLYYATSGIPGYGSTDLFISRRLDESWTKWSEPENLGPHINTSGFDAYYTIPASGEWAYFTSSTDGKQIDIWRMKLPESMRPEPVVVVYGRVLNAKTNEPVAADIFYESYSTGEEQGKAKSSYSDGKYKIILPAGDQYGFLAEAEGYASINENLDLRELGAYAEIEKDLYLAPLEKGQIVRLNNIFFDTNEYTFREETYLELKRLVKLMQDNPGLKIEISGHTDDQGSDSYNQTLSENRAKAVYDYVKQAGIEGSRLTFKGYGESKPVGSNATEEGRQKNRRVEFIIMEI